MQQLFLEDFFCENCGGDLEPQPAGDCLKCQCCRSIYSVAYTEKEKKFLDEALDAHKQETLKNLTQRMWEQLDRPFIDSDVVVDICREIRNLYPDHFYARFYEIANSGTDQEINAFMDAMPDDEEESKVLNVAQFMLRSLKNENVYSLRSLADRTLRARGLASFRDLTSQINKEAKKVSHGAYDCSLPRDVFVACVDEDLPEAEKLVKELEEQDISCFLVSQNVQRGRDSLKNSKAGIEQAIAACRMFVFVSSRHSRKMCDVLKNQVGYLRTHDMAQVPAEYKQTAYEKIPMGYKKLRVQWRLDNDHAYAFAEKTVDSIFAGADTCKSMEELLDKIGEYALCDFSVEAPMNPQLESLKQDMDSQFQSIRQAQEDEARRQAEIEAQRRKDEEERRKIEEANRKRLEMCLERFEQVLAMPPAALNERAAMYEQQLRATPNDTKINASLGFVYLKLRLFDKALEVFEKAMATQSNNPEVYFWAGVCQLKGKKAFMSSRPDIDKAEAYVNAALQLAPNKGLYYYFLAYVRYDYYQRKFFKASPNYSQYFEMAKKCGVTTGEVNNLYAVMGVPRPSVL